MSKTFLLHLSGSDVKIILFLPIWGTFYLSDILLCDSKSHCKPKSEILLLDILLEGNVRNATFSFECGASDHEIDLLCFQVIYEANLYN